MAAAAAAAAVAAAARRRCLGAGGGRERKAVRPPASDAVLHTHTAPLAHSRPPASSANSRRYLRPGTWPGGREGGRREERGGRPTATQGAARCGRTFACPARFLTKSCANLPPTGRPISGMSSYPRHMEEEEEEEEERGCVRSSQCPQVLMPREPRNRALYLLKETCC